MKSKVKINVRYSAGHTYKHQNEHFYRFTVERKDLPFMCTNCGVDLTTLSQILEEGDF